MDRPCPRCGAYGGGCYECLDRLATDCLLAAKVMEDTDTFPTGQGILREAAATIAAWNRRTPAPAEEKKDE